MTTRLRRVSTPADRHADTAVRRWRRQTSSAGTVAIIDPGGPPEEDLVGVLERMGLSVVACSDPVRAVARLAADPPRVVVLCVRRPDPVLAQVVDVLRSEVGVEVLLAWDPAHLELAEPAILAGARPVLSLPLDAGEMLDGLRAMWPTAPLPTEVLWIGDLRVDPGGFEARLGGRPLDLSPGEMTVLAELAAHAGHTVPRALLYRLWPRSVDPDANLVSAVTRLRRKLADAGVDEPISTVRGVGYRLEKASVARPAGAALSSR